VLSQFEYAANTPIGKHAYCAQNSCSPTPVQFSLCDLGRSPEYTEAVTSVWCTVCGRYPRRFCHRQLRSNPSRACTFVPVVTGRRRSSPVVASRRQSLPVVASRLQSSPVVTGCHQSSPVVAGRLQSSPVVASRRQSSPVVSSRRQSSPVVTSRRQSSPVVAGRRSSVNYLRPERPPVSRLSRRRIWRFMIAMYGSFSPQTSVFSGHLPLEDYTVEDISRRT